MYVPMYKYKFFPGPHFYFIFQIQSSKYAKIGPKQSKCPRIIAGQPGGLPVPAQSKFDRGNRRGNHRNGFTK